MTVHNPDTDEIFWAGDLKCRLRYVGRTASGEFVLEHIDEPFLATGLITVTPEYVRRQLVPWTEAAVILERGQMWRRSRHDFSDRSARVLEIVAYEGDNFVIYEETYSSRPNPKMKKEIDFRRVYGRLIHSEA